jgi:hypothetical protein
MEEGEEMSKGLKDYPKGAKTEGSELNGEYPVVAAAYDIKPVFRIKQDIRGASQGHSGPGGAMNPNDNAGNTPEMLQKGRYHITSTKA